MGGGAGGGAAAPVDAAGPRPGAAVATAGADADADAPVPPKLLTLVIPQVGGRLLLGKKLRGFGEGYFNGFGGKVERGETIEVSARRELTEEAGVDATDLEHVGLLRFTWAEQPQPWLVYVFRVTAFSGDPTPSDEMQPLWMSPEELPFDRMWADDVHWYPLFLAGKRFQGEFLFRDTHTLVAHDVWEVDALELPTQPS